MTMSMSNVTSIMPFLEKANSIFELQQAHAHMLKLGLNKDIFATSRLIAFAATNPDTHTIAYAHSIFSYINNPNSFIWNSMIRAYANSSDPKNAVVIFSQMLDSTVTPDKYSYPFVIKACSCFDGLREGLQIHGQVVKRKEIRDNVYVQNTLISMYANFGYFELARNLLDSMLQRDVISWNAMLSAFTEQGLMDSAQLLFDEMEQRDVESWNFMLSGYVKLGLIEEARRVFDEVPVKDVVSWNVIITGYARVGNYSEVFALFMDMLSKNMKPDYCTIVNVLSACSHLGALSQGQWIHAYIRKNGICVKGFLATALVDMYSKCGDIKKAFELFNNTFEKDVSTWNSMIGGLSINGHGEQAVKIFQEMQQVGVKPNEVTFINVLSACGHAGLVLDGVEIFDQMIHGYEIHPKIEHYGCMVDLLSRAGLLEEAKEFLKVVPIEDSPVLWQSLLASCRYHGNVKLAVSVGQKLLELDPLDSSVYVQLSNVYASTGKWNKVAEIRKKMKAQGAKKEPGCSLIEIDGVVHEFLAGDALDSIADLPHV